MMVNVQHKTAEERRGLAGDSFSRCLLQSLMVKTLVQNCRSYIDASINCQIRFTERTSDDGNLNLEHVLPGYEYWCTLGTKSLKTTTLENGKQCCYIHDLLLIIYYKQIHQNRCSH